MQAKRSVLRVVLISLLAVGLTSHSVAQHPPLNVVNYGVGDNAFPYLHLWSGVDQVSAHLYASVNGGLRDNAFFYNDSPISCPGIGYPNCGVSAFNGAARTATSKFAYGGWSYAEADTPATATATAWGARLLARTYSSLVPAHGVEVNGLNATNGAPVTDGVFIVMGGNAKTTAGMVMATGAWAPAGRPDYGMMLAGPNSNYGGGAVPTLPASVTGVYIDQIASGEAIRIQRDQRVALTGSGTTYFRYDSASDKVQLVKNNVVVAQW